jgi:Na+-transporting NADH:ubiquinone oxidoreductase subunit NqrC
MVHKALILFTVYFTFKWSANIASLIFAVSLPAALVLAHASFRLRNLNSKLANLDKSTKIITPMQSLLDMFDMMVQVTRDRSTWAALSYSNDRQLRPKHKTSVKEH